ncbi:hypothetical protein H6G65_15210 [Microcystis elabens FACHB-917]|nr:hypothetical protein [Microcystis elabens FACHB-917]
MSDLNLAQSDADALLALEKHKVDNTVHEYPILGGSLKVPLISRDRREEFLLDVYQNQINLAKGTYQNRARRVVILARLDFGGAPHRNPDDVEIPCPHLHLYREGFGDKWAFPVPPEAFPSIADRWQTLQDFLRYVNVTDPPDFRRSLFT